MDGKQPVFSSNIKQQDRCRVHPGEAERCGQGTRYLRVSQTATSSVEACILIKEQHKAKGKFKWGELVGFDLEEDHSGH